MSSPLRILRIGIGMLVWHSYRYHIPRLGASCRTRQRPSPCQRGGVMDSRLACPRRRCGSRQRDPPDGWAQHFRQFDAPAAVRVGNAWVLSAGRLPVQGRAGAEDDIGIHTTREGGAVVLLRGSSQLALPLAGGRPSRPYGGLPIHWEPLERSASRGRVRYRKCDTGDSGSQD